MTLPLAIEQTRLLLGLNIQRGQQEMLVHPWDGKFIGVA